MFWVGFLSGVIAYIVLVGAMAVYQYIKKKKKKGEND